MTRTISHIFPLEIPEDYDRAEAFKAQLENDGWTVTMLPFGSVGVRVCGVR